MKQLSHRIYIALLLSSLATAHATPIGFDADKLAKVSNKLQSLVDQQAIAGAVVLIARNGKVALHEARGVSDIKSGAPMKKDTIFRIYSMTKPITTTAVMMLVEEGKISPSDPVSKYIPELKNLKVYASKKNDQKATKAMTVSDLMRHTSGLSYGFTGGPIAKLYREKRVLDRNSSLKQMIDKLSTIPLQAEPGSSWVYSVSIDVLGRLVEVVTKKSFS